MSMNRREAIGLLGASVLAAAADPVLQFAALDHVEIYVPDAARSAAFYAAVFGGPVWKNNKTPRRYVRLGPCYIAIEQGPEARRFDHFSAGMEGFQIASIHSYLDGRGIAYRDYPSGKDLNVTDPDGARAQLSEYDSWRQLAVNTASPEAVPAGAAEPIFGASGLDHILLNVSDPEKSATFYAKIFGPVTQRNNNRIWFQVGKSRVGILQTPAGQHAGVNHFCVSAASFDYSAAIAKLERAGAKVETPEAATAPEFRDADGFLVQVLARR